MTILTTSNGTDFLIDDEDVAKLSEHNPRLIFHLTNGGYIYFHSDKIVTNLFLHRFLLDYSGIFDVGHKDSNRLNNQKENLMVMTRSENNFLRKTKVGETGQRGIVWHKRDKRYQVGIYKDNKRIHLGYYKTLEEAIEVRKKAETIHYGDILKHVSNT